MTWIWTLAARWNSVCRYLNWCSNSCNVHSGNNIYIVDSETCRASVGSHAIVTNLLIGLLVDSVRTLRFEISQTVDYISGMRSCLSRRGGPWTLF